MPTFRNLWAHIRDELPKKGRQRRRPAEPKLPAELEGALHSLYGNYEQRFAPWEASDPAAAGATPPVFIVVCNNTTVSKLVFDYIAGWEQATRRRGDDGRPAARASSTLFSNVDDDGGWLARPRTILVDSAQLESGDAMSDRLQAVAAAEIESSRPSTATASPAATPTTLTDEDLLREVMNTVGKPGRLGEHVRCVVSVSMLTEGWDANTVTHILGVRAFGTQLLCEQVVGRGLRRRSYAVDEDGPFAPEYAEVYGVPFSFIPAGGRRPSRPTQPLTRVRALRNAPRCEITLPARRRLPLRARPTSVSPPTFDERLAARRSPPSDVPTETDVDGIVGERRIHTLDDLASRATQEVAFDLAKRRRSTRYFGDDAGDQDRPWLFPQLVRLVRLDGSTDVPRTARTTPSRSCSCSPSARPTPPTSIYQAIVARRHEASRTAARRPARPTTRRLDRRTSTSTPRSRRWPTEPSDVPRHPRRRRLRLGADVAPGARGDGRGRPLRQERPPRLHHPLHASTASSRRYRPTSSSASTTATAPTTC